MSLLCMSFSLSILLVILLLVHFALLLLFGAYPHFRDFHTSLCGLLLVWTLLLSIRRCILGMTQVRVQPSQRSAEADSVFMIGCQRIPLTEVRDIFIFRTYLCQYIYALSYQYSQFMYITCICFSYHCFLDGILYDWIFVCVCCAAPDKLTSPPLFTGLGALQQ